MAEVLSLRRKRASQRQTCHLPCAKSPRDQSELDGRACPAWPRGATLPDSRIPSSSDQGSRAPKRAGKTKAVKFERSIEAGNLLTTEERNRAELLLAHLVANAYAADHPEAFADKAPRASIMGNVPETPAPALSGRGNQGTVTAGGIHAPLE